MGVADKAVRTLQIGLVGDFIAQVPAHQAIPLALQMAADALQVKVAITWLPTPEIGDARASGSSTAYGACRVARIRRCRVR